MCKSKSIGYWTPHRAFERKMQIWKVYPNFLVVKV